VHFTNNVIAIKMARVEIKKTSGGGGAMERRHDWQDPFDYCGLAPLDTLENAPLWTITRIEVFLDGTTDVKSATNVAWTDRYIVIYT
jgi:hypothetical protein